MNGEILRLSYWEHFKRAKELSLIYPKEDKRRIIIENEINKLQKELKL